jgi:Protein of unknown function (DUF1302)
LSLHLTLSRARTGRTFVRSRLAAAAALALAAGGVQAMEIETPDPDLSIRWDNTARVNLGVRVEGRDSKIANTAIADEGTYSFDKGDFVAKRIDWLSELDVVYKKQYGARISGTGWYDAAYGDKSHSNPNPPLVNIPSYIGNEYSGTTKRLYHGGTGELLDAFVFGRIDLGDVPVQAKLGRHTVYWGESVLLGGNLHGIAYSQNPLDLQKGFATPGTEAKELFRPLNQLSVQAQLTDTLSVAAQGMLEWEAARYPEGGTYLGPVDFVFNGPDRQFLSPALGFATRGAASEPKNTGEWGLSARWAPEWLDGTMGLYYRKFADKLPQVLLTQACAAGSTTATPACADPTLGSRYNLVYADNIDLLGVSLGKNIAGVSVGAEFSYRHNTPLFSQVLGVAPGLPAEGDTKGAKGNTIHAVVNALGTVAKTPVFDQATWLAEVTYAHWTSVTSGANLFNAVGYAPCLANGTSRTRDFDKWDGCVTRDYVGTGVAFTPTWFQVLPGVDLSAPLTYAVGLYGNSPTVFGGNQGLGNYTLGVSADWLQKYRFDLKYIDFVGHTRDNGTSVTSQNGLTAFLKDRGFVSLTFRTTF